MPAMPCPWVALHDLILGHTSSLFSAFHGIASIEVLVFDIGEAERTPTILVAREFGYEKVSVSCKPRLMERIHTDGGLSIIGIVELHDTGATRAPIGFILNLCTFNFADRGEELNQIIVASGPW